MKLVRNLTVGLVLAGALALAGPAEARHRHNSRCDHRSYQSQRYDRHSRHDYRYDRRHDYRQRYDYRYDRYDYGYRYRPPVRYHYHGRSRCSRGHVGVYFGF